MRTLWVTRDIDAPASRMWHLLVDTRTWPVWGPTVRSATIAGGTMRLGARGTVRTIVGVGLPFAITSYTEGREWSWDVLGIPATSHAVEALGENRCRVGFGVPWPAGPYLAVCRLALHKLAGLASEPPHA